MGQRETTMAEGRVEREFEPREHRLASPDGDLSVYEWPGDGQVVFFAHATGFHARCWDEVIRLLPGYHCFAMDALGHGNSASPPPPEAYAWDRLADGARAIVERLNGRPGTRRGSRPGDGASGRRCAVTGFGACLLAGSRAAPLP